MLSFYSRSWTPVHLCLLLIWPGRRRESLTDITCTSSSSHFRINTINGIQDELEMDMRLLGARTIREIVPEMVDASNMHNHVATVPIDRLYEGNCMSVITSSGPH
jgi:hypothetical protein